MLHGSVATAVQSLDPHCEDSIVGLERWAEGGGRRFSAVQHLEGVVAPWHVRDCIWFQKAPAATWSCQKAQAHTTHIWSGFEHLVVSVCDLVCIGSDLSLMCPFA
jgi:hypothetical protein